MQLMNMALYQIFIFRPRVGLNPISKSNKTQEYCPPPLASLHLFVAGSPQSAAIMACRWRNAMCLSDLLKIHTSECQIKVLGY